MDFLAQISGADKYTKPSKDDLPFAATFKSLKQSLMVYLEPVDMKTKLIGNKQQEVRERNSGLRVRFTDHKLFIKNKVVLAKLLEMMKERPNVKFTIDDSDPTGFWRAIGAVEEGVVVITKPVAGFSLDPGNVLSKEALARVAKIKAANVEPAREIVEE